MNPKFIIKGPEEREKSWRDVAYYAVEWLGLIGFTSVISFLIKACTQ